MRLLVLTLICVVIIFSDNRRQKFESVRKVLTVVVAPIQYLVNTPVDMLNWLDASASSRSALQNENAHLKADQLLLKAQLQKLLSIEKENSQLRALLNTQQRVTNKVVAAQLLAVNTDPYIQQIILRKGKDDEVKIGQAVLDANGVMGQIVRVTPFTSYVLLITDTRSAIPVQDNRNGERAIAVGNGALGSLSIINMPVTTKIKKGDLLVTSGLGQRYPAGYPVGVVMKVNRNSGEHFAEITLQPSAQLNRSSIVLLVSPNVSSQSKVNDKKMVSGQTYSSSQVKAKQS